MNGGCQKSVIYKNLEEFSMIILKEKDMLKVTVLVQQGALHI